MDFPGGLPMTIQTVKRFFLALLALCVSCSDAFAGSSESPAAVEQTLSIIKPDAVAANHIGDIIARFEANGLQIVALKMAHLTKAQAGEFYAVHKERPFYPELVEFMSSNPVVIMVLQGDNAVAKNRQLMGATDPAKAEKGSLRADFATSVSHNAVHGSDSRENAATEIAFFFTPAEIFQRQ
jgi:nucleoside-diphosphate kinase